MSITLDTDLSGRTDDFNPAELLLAALAACMIKGIERGSPILKFNLRGVDIRLNQADVTGIAMVRAPSPRH